MIVELAAVFGVVTGVLTFFDHPYAWVAAVLTGVCLAVLTVRYVWVLVQTRRDRRDRGQQLDGRV